MNGRITRSNFLKKKKKPIKANAGSLSTVWPRSLDTAIDSIRFRGKDLFLCRFLRLFILEQRSRDNVVFF